MIEIIAIGAEWCVPCVAMKPAIAALAAEWNVEGSGITVTSVDIDAVPSVVAEWGVRSVPLMLFKSDGVVVKRHSGVLTADDIRHIVETLTLNLPV